MLGAIFFDCDGVLVDTERLKFNAWNDALAPLDIQISVEQYSRLVGYSSNEIINKIEAMFAVSLDREEVIKAKRESYALAHGKGVKKINRQVILLKKLLNMRMAGWSKLKLGVVSSDSLSNIRSNLRSIKVPVSALDLVISGNDHLPEGLNKPHPAIYMEAATRAHVHPRKCLVLEDTPAGSVSAGKAGMCVLATPNEFTSRLEFPLAFAMINPHQEDLSVNELFSHFKKFDSKRGGNRKRLSTPTSFKASA